MDKFILETLAAKAMEHIDMAGFAEQLAPKLLKEMEKGILAEVKVMDWSDFVYELLQNDDVQKVVVSRVINGLKGIS